MSVLQNAVENEPLLVMRRLRFSFTDYPVDLLVQFQVLSRYEIGERCLANDNCRTGNNLTRGDESSDHLKDICM